MTKPEPTDMSPAAIERRLEQVRALYHLMQSLATARVVPGRRSRARIEVDLRAIGPVIARVIERWQPLQIWLFGSRARGDAHPDSDWDLLAVVPDSVAPADFDDPMVVWRVKRQPGVSSDLVVYRASEFADDREVPNTLAYVTTREGLLIYER